MNKALKDYSRWVLPIFMIALVTPFTPFLDLEFERHFYEEGHFQNTSLLQFIYDWGVFPGQVTGVLALVGILLSFLLPSCRHLRKISLFIALTLAIGSGLFIHLMLKDHWGRPRPRQVIEFGGTQEFRPYYSPNFFNQPEPSKSFTCGHCSLGFYFFAFILLGRRYNIRWLFNLGIFLTLLLGLSLSYARMAQGGHFFSDVLFSALIMWLTALALDRFLYGEAK